MRVSKADGSQNTARQKKDLLELAQAMGFDVVETIKEAASGKIKKRPGTEAIIKMAKAGKIKKVLVHEVSRLGRNLADVARIVEELAEVKVSVFDCKTRQETLDSKGKKTTYANIILPLFAGMAEEWTQDHSYRVKSGLAMAKAKGKRLGRPKSDKIKHEAKIRKALGEGLSKRKCAVFIGVSDRTVLKVMSKIKNEVSQSPLTNTTF